MDIVTIDIMIYDSTGSLQGSTGWYEASVDQKLLQEFLKL